MAGDSRLTIFILDLMSGSFVRVAGWGRGRHLYDILGCGHDIAAIFLVDLHGILGWGVELLI